MELGNFLTAEQSVKHTGIQPGEWFVASCMGEPFRVFKCADYDGPPRDAVHAQLKDKTFIVFSSRNSWKLDTDYTEEQLAVLAARAAKEYFQYRANKDCERKYGAKAMGVFTDVLQ